MPSKNPQTTKKNTVKNHAKRNYPIVTYASSKKSYLNGTLSLKKWQKLGIFCLLVAISGVIGWLYEFIFYYFNSDMTEFNLQGGNFLPWINIYAIGALLILLTTKKLKSRPLLVFLVSALVTGALEFLSGWAIYKIGNGTRYWDYNTEIWNFGNIGGFVCLRSFLAFGLSALLLVYVLMPFLINLSENMSKKSFLILSISLCSIFLIDEFYNLLASKIFTSLPDAIEIYRSHGFKYVGD